MRRYSRREAAFAAEVLMDYAQYIRENNWFPLGVDPSEQVERMARYTHYHAEKVKFHVETLEHELDKIEEAKK